MARYSFVLMALVCAIAAPFAGDLESMFSGDRDLAPIEYATRATHDAVSELDARIQAGTAKLGYDEFGYLTATLKALNIPVESQLLVFSKTSLQKALISAERPRSLYFNDSVAVGWVPGEPFVEIAAEDPQQGVVFYTIDQFTADRVSIHRANFCLSCHESLNSLGVPGMLMRSVYPSATGEPIRMLGDHLTDHRSPFGERWGGWYVTGRTNGLAHLGNRVFAESEDEAPAVRSADPESLSGRIDTSFYETPYSDIVALMVFEHQMRMMNLLTRVGWEYRFATHAKNSNEPLLRETVNELVNYMLFVDEPPLRRGVRGTSGFAEKFAARGPVDKEGRSLRQFDLERRLLRYPCSYMIYAPAFDGLSAAAKEAIYRRLWAVLSGAEKSRLGFAERRAVVEILRETKAGLPDYFGDVTR